MWTSPRNGNITPTEGSTFGREDRQQESAPAEKIANKKVFEKKSRSKVKLSMQGRVEADTETLRWVDELLGKMDELWVFHLQSIHFHDYTQLCIF